VCVRACVFLHTSEGLAFALEAKTQFYLADAQVLYLYTCIFVCIYIYTSEGLDFAREAKKLFDLADAQVM
jgi:hypothetical protein